MIEPMASREGSLSVVIPAFNEAGNIGDLVIETIDAVPASLLREIVVVDDCSDDGTEDVLKRLSVTIPALRYVRHGARAGQSAALRTGVRTATAPLIATMDGDGQNDPRDILKLLAALEAPSGETVVLAGGVRTQRRAEASKRIASKAANWIRDAVLADHCPDTGCGIKVIRRDVFMDLPYFSGMHRYLPALVRAYGCAAVYVPVNDRPRRTGVSKYSNLGRALIGIYDLVGVRWLIRRTVLPNRSTALALREQEGAHRSLAQQKEPACLQS
jgi:dolichol-phosphate mannosyltransferase